MGSLVLILIFKITLKNIYVYIFKILITEFSGIPFKLFYCLTGLNLFPAPFLMFLVNRVQVAPFFFLFSFFFKSRYN